MNLGLKNRIYQIIIITICFSFDQFTKNFINFNYLKIINKDLIIFTIEYVKNDGAAFSLFSGSRLFLSIISITSTLILSYFIFIKEKNTYNNYGLSFILAGTLGNGIDRVLTGQVIDFIKIKFISFPVFNIADVLINLGVLILIINFLKNKN